MEKDTYIARYRLVIRERDRLEAALAEAQTRGDTDAIGRLRARLEDAGRLHSGLTDADLRSA